MSISRFTRFASAFAGVGASLALAIPAHATFHLMQIEVLIGGVNGNSSMQAIQLRERGFYNNFCSGGRLIAHDAAGLNPIVLTGLLPDVAGSSPGDRILITSAAMQTDPPVTPDAIMTSLIPVSYFAAGSITWEDYFGGVQWRVCWGGSAYTGPTDMSIYNDLNGNCAPPFGGPLPSSSLQTLFFTGVAEASSTTNLADYAVTGRAGVLSNNLGASGVIIAPACTGDITGTNHSVDVNDLLAVITTWGLCAACPPSCLADIAPPGGDCAVNVNDLLAVITHWGPCP